MTDEKKEDQPRIITGLVMKMPGEEATVDYALWFAPEGRLPAKESVLAYLSECLNVFYDQTGEPRKGGVGTMKDLIGDLFGLLPELPEGMDQRVRSDLGEPVAIGSVYFDKYEAATEEYDEDGTDCVVVAPVT